MEFFVKKVNHDEKFNESFYNNWSKPDNKHPKKVTQ